MTYQSIVAISNEVRFVLNTTYQVNLTAQNASLAARRAGNVRGFQAVASSLKVFSQELADAMNAMSEEILAMARDVSLDYRLRRNCSFFASALGVAMDDMTLENALEGVSRQRASVMDQLCRRTQHLGPRLQSSLRLCSKGRALARSATIEAAYGGSSESLLRNVAHSIERTIEEIHQRLKAIIASLKLSMDECI